MPTVPIDWLCAKRVVEMLRAHPRLDEATVYAGLPGDKTIGAEAVWLDEIDGTIQASLMMDGRKSTDHLFTIPVIWTVRSRLTADECQARLAEIKGAVHDVVVETACLEDFDGVVSALPSEEPVRSRADETPSDGWLGYGRYDIEVHVRID